MSDLRIGYRAFTLEPSKPARPKAPGPMVFLRDVYERWKPVSSVKGLLNDEVEELMGELRSSRLSKRSLVPDDEGTALVEAFALRLWRDAIVHDRLKRPAELLLAARVLDRSDAEPAIRALSRLYDETGMVSRHSLYSGVLSSFDRLQKEFPQVQLASEVETAFRVGNWGIFDGGASIPLPSSTPAQRNAPTHIPLAREVLETWKRTRIGRAMETALGRAEVSQSGSGWVSFRMKDPRFGFGLRPDFCLIFNFSADPEPRVVVDAFTATKVLAANGRSVSAHAIPAMLRILHESMKRNAVPEQTGALHGMIRDLAAFGGLTPTEAEFASASLDPILELFKVSFDTTT